MYKDSLLPVMWLNDNRNQARAIEAGIFDLMITTDDSGKARLLNDINKRIEIFNNNLEAYEKTKLEPFEKDTLKELHANLDKYRNARREGILRTLAVIFALQICQLFISFHETKWKSVTRNRFAH